MFKLEYIFIKDEDSKLENLSNRDNKFFQKNGLQRDRRSQN